ncbi:unnamed protein product, partial [Mesorhabditis spiculigera]
MGLDTQRSFVFLIFLAVIEASYIANDVVSDYAQVRELLNEFYGRSARRIGSDYDPAAIGKDDGTVVNDGTEHSVNRKLWTEVFENDIILTLDQAQKLLREQGPHPRNKRQAEPNPNKFWSNLTISYEFAVTDSTWQNQIRQALRHVESQTCMRFREGGSDRNRLQFIRGSGCWSNVGMIGGRQQVSVGYGCEWMGIISHETLHALGLWHEQSRNDRDDFISLRSQYIIRGTIGNFEKRTPQTSDNIGQPYDLGSVMHYGPKAFTTDWGQNTIATRDPNFQQTIGQREGISFKDAKMINTRYCTKVCPQTLSCQNEGYTDPNNCGYCRCPSGYGGRYCQHVSYVAGSGGGELTAYDSWYRIITDFVKPTTNTVYRIKAAPGQRIELLFEEVSFLCRDTCKSYVEIKYKNTKTQAGARLCCQKPGVIISEGNEVVLIYRGEPDLPNGYHGFTLRYRIYKYRAASRTTSHRTWFGHWKKGRQGNALDGSPETNITEIPEAKPVPPTDEDGEEATEAPSTKTTTTTTTTYKPPAKTTNGEWGDWGDWSTCSHACGGCGTRVRVRACYGGNRNCQGKKTEEESCNIHQCIYRKKYEKYEEKEKKLDNCKGQIVLPCDLMEKLYFGKKVNRVKRSVNDSNQCERSFTYACPTNLLTIHVDWKAPSDVQSDPPACCEGYYASGTQCYKY